MPAQKDVLSAVKTESVTPAEISLKTLPVAKRYTDIEKTFTIWMPNPPKSVTFTPPADPIKGSAKAIYKWDVAEGFLAVTKSKYEHRTFDAEADVTNILTQIKEAITKDPETKFVSEKGVSAGKWRGADLVFNSGDWIKTLVRVLAAGNETYIVTATVNPNAPDTEKLLIQAIGSLEIKAAGAVAAGDKITKSLPKK